MSTVKTLTYTQRLLLVMGLVTLLFSVGLTQAVVVRDGKSIQAAIEIAEPGDLIEVHNGIYHENIVVNKKLNLKGVGSPVICSSDENSVITLLADGITIENFEVVGSDSKMNSGIWVESNDNTIRNNLIYENSNGIYLNNAENISIHDNNVSYNDIGIYILESNNTTIRYNEIDCNFGGVLIHTSPNTTVENNTIKDNKAGIEIYLANMSYIIHNDIIYNWYGFIYSHIGNNVIECNTFYGNVVDEIPRDPNDMHSGPFTIRLFAPG